MCGVRCGVRHKAMENKANVSKSVVVCVECVECVVGAHDSEDGTTAKGRNHFHPTTHIMKLNKSRIVSRWGVNGYGGVWCLVCPPSIIHHACPSSMPIHPFPTILCHQCPSMPSIHPSIDHPTHNTNHTEINDFTLSLHQTTTTTTSTSSTSSTYSSSSI